jgi:hypothetical protein
MFFIKEINSLSFNLLERIYRQSRHHQVRQRAHFLILAAQGAKVKELMKILKSVTRQYITGLIDGNQRGW